MTYLTNTQSPTGQHLIISSDGSKVGFDSPGDAREWLRENGQDEVMFDGDGNGSMVSIPSEWIGDGEFLENSQRVLDLIWK